MNPTHFTQLIDPGEGGQVFFKNFLRVKNYSISYRSPKEKLHKDKHPTLLPIFHLLT